MRLNAPSSAVIAALQALWHLAAGHRCELCRKRSWRCRVNGSRTLQRYALLCPECDRSEKWD